MTILLVVLPYGTAIICGALTEWAGRTVSGWCSIGGLALGIYFFSKSMDFLALSRRKCITDAASVNLGAAFFKFGNRPCHLANI